MESKEEIVKNWLPRYTGATLDQFGSYILLTNFDNYLQKFAEWHGVEIIGRGKAMPMATADGITMINFSMGSANAATIMDLLSAIMPKIVEYGNTTNNSRNICVGYAQWPSTWKRPHSSQSVLRIKFQPEPCCW